jgi:hypothetical protein
MEGVSDAGGGVLEDGEDGLLGSGRGSCEVCLCDQLEVDRAVLVAVLGCSENQRADSDVGVRVIGV